MLGHKRDIARVSWKSVIPKPRIPLFRLSVASLASLVLAVVVATPAFADCYNNRNNLYYCAWASCPDEGTTSPSDDWFYARVVTQNGACSAWPSTNCPYTYQTQGAKGNITTGGVPQTYTTSDHVVSYVNSSEYGPDCQTANQTTAGGCWVQVGWLVGYIATPPTSPPTSYGPQVSIQTNGKVHVYVEIYDDSSSPCLLGDYGAAPSIASYDERWYTNTGGNAPNEYAVYYEAPGTNNIQILAYANFRDQNTTKIAASEVHVVHLQGYGYPYCSVLGDTPDGYWNVFGQPGTPSQNLFAGPMNLRVAGAWQNWTDSAVRSNGYIYPVPAGHNPYQIQAISNFGGGDYTEWESGGPHA